MTLIAHKGAVDLLLKIIESRNARLSGAIIRANFNEAGLVLLGSDLLTKVGQTDVVATMDDYEDEPARVEWSPKQESYGFYSGRGKWVSVPADDLTLYGLKMPNFLNQLLVRCEQITPHAKDPLITDILWDLGTVKLGARSKPVPIWFARRLFDDRNRRQIEAMAAKRPPAEVRVIVTATDDCIDFQVAGHLTLAIRDIAEADTGFVIDPTTIVRRLKLVPSSVLKPIRHSADYGTIYIGDRTYKFRGVQHRAILTLLVDGYNDNDPIWLTADILDEVKPGPNVTNLARAFSGNKDWRKFIKEEDGQCWIEF